MAMIARPAAQRLGPAIPTGFGMLMKWLAENDDGLHCPWCGEAHAALEGAQQAYRGGRKTVRNLKSLRGRGRKAKRKVSAYQKEFGRQLKKLKRAHPRTPVTRLMKRAHAATRRARK